jgi:hypothetical protein
MANIRKTVAQQRRKPLIQKIKIINKKTERLKSDTEKPFYVNEESKLPPKNIRKTKEKRAKIKKRKKRMKK